MGTVPTTSSRSGSHFVLFCYLRSIPNADINECETDGGLVSIIICEKETASDLILTFLYCYICTGCTLKVVREYSVFLLESFTQYRKDAMLNGFQMSLSQ